MNDPRTHEENGVRWNEKWIYRLEDGEERVVYWHRYDCRGVFLVSTRREREAGVALSGPPPLAPIGLVLRRDGSFWHEGVRVTHPRLHAALLAGVRFAEDEQTFVVQLQNFRGWLEVEDTAFFVTEYDAATGEIALSDRTREPLDAATLRSDARRRAALFG